MTFLSLPNPTQRRRFIWLIILASCSVLLLWIWTLPLNVGQESDNHNSSITAEFIQPASQALGTTMRHIKQSDQ